MGLNIRVGMGFDVHRLVEGRELWLGGIKIEHTDPSGTQTESACPGPAHCTPIR